MYVCINNYCSDIICCNFVDFITSITMLACNYTNSTSAYKCMHGALCCYILQYYIVWPACTVLYIYMYVHGHALMHGILYSYRPYSNCACGRSSMTCTCNGCACMPCYRDMCMVCNAVNRSKMSSRVNYAQNARAKTITIHHGL